MSSISHLEKFYFCSEPVVHGFQVQSDTEACPERLSLPTTPWNLPDVNFLMYHYGFLHL